MKLKFIFIALLSVFIFGECRAADMALKQIYAHQAVRCGTDLSSKTYAYKDKKEGVWKGIDADLCRALALAVLGNSDAIEMVNVNVDEIAKALQSNKIDIMLGNSAISANYEVSTNARAVDVIYFDKQVFMAHPVDGATSMTDYKGATVCVMANSADAYNVREYSRKYGLQLKLIPLRNMSEARTAFFTNRCKLFSATELYLTGLTKSIVNSNLNVKILPEVIAYRPVYAFVDKRNGNWQTTSKWVLNALPLAESLGISSQNIDTIIGVDNLSTKYLLGIDPTLWKKFNVNPNWFKKAMKEMGNFGEIYERNIGKDSIIGVERDKNNLIENGGYIITKPFL